MGMSKPALIGVFKVGHRKYMEELLYEGHVFMNTAGYFAKLDSSSASYDPDEGTDFCHNVDGFKFHVEEGKKWQELGTLMGGMRFRNKAMKGQNIFCLHGRTSEDYGKAFQLNELDFGDTYVVFLNFPEFIRRMELEVEKHNLSLAWREVRYVHRSYTGEMDIFTKFDERRAEQEVRIALTPGTGLPLSLRLGNLSDIAIMGSTDKRVLFTPGKPASGN